MSQIPAIPQPPNEQQSAKSALRTPEPTTATGGGITPNYRERLTGDSQNLAGVPEEFMRLFEHDPSEVILYQALRHPIGVFTIYASAGIAIFLVLVFIAMVASNPSGFLGIDASDGIISVLALVAFFLIILTAGLSYAAAYVYKKSRMILTNQKVVFIQYHSLFSREVSQLNIGEVEDVNVAQRTIADRIFKTGNITIETAGEQNNYVLSHVQNPHDFAQKTIQAHEGLIAEYGN